MTFKKEKAELLRSFEISSKVITEIIKANIINGLNTERGLIGVPEYQSLGAPFSEIKYQYLKSEDRRYFNCDVFVSDKIYNCSEKYMNGCLNISCIKGKSKSNLERVVEIISSFNKSFFLKHSKEDTKKWYSFDEGVEEYLNELVQNGKNVSATTMKGLCSEYLNTYIETLPYEKVLIKRDYVESLINYYFDKKILSRKLLISCGSIENNQSFIDKLIETNYLKKNRSLTKLIAESCYLKLHNKPVNVKIDFKENTFNINNIEDVLNSSLFNESYKYVFKEHYVSLPEMYHDDKEINIKINVIISDVIKGKNYLKGVMSKNILKTFRLFTTPMKFRDYDLIIPVKKSKGRFDLEYNDIMDYDLILKYVFGLKTFNEEIQKYKDEDSKDEYKLEGLFLKEFLQSIFKSMRTLDKLLIPGYISFIEEIDHLNCDKAFEKIKTKLLDMYVEAWKVHTISENDIFDLSDIEYGVSSLRLKGRARFKSVHSEDLLQPIVYTHSLENDKLDSSSLEVEDKSQFESVNSENSTQPINFATSKEIDPEEKTLSVYLEKEETSINEENSENVEIIPTTESITNDNMKDAFDYLFYKSLVITIMALIAATVAHMRHSEIGFIMNSIAIGMIGFTTTLFLRKRKDKKQ